MKKKLQSIILAVMMAFAISVTPIAEVLTLGTDAIVVEAATKKTIKTFTVHSLYNTYKKVTGKGLKGAKVRVYAKGKLIGSATVRKNGTYSVYIPKQPTGRTVTVKISKSGYKTRTKCVKVKRDHHHSSYKYVYANGGNSKSKKYHKSAHAHNMEGAIKMTESKAKSKGYVRCRVCW